MYTLIDFCHIPSGLAYHSVKTYWSVLLSALEGLYTVVEICPFEDYLRVFLCRCSTWIFAISQQTPLLVTTVPSLIWFWCTACHGGVIIFHSWESPLMKSAQSFISGWFPRKNLLATNNLPFRNVCRLNSISVLGNFLSLKIPSFQGFHCWIPGIFLCYRRLRPIETTYWNPVPFSQRHYGVRKAKLADQQASQGGYDWILERCFHTKGKLWIYKLRGTPEVWLGKAGSCFCKPSTEETNAFVNSVWHE